MSINLYYLRTFLFSIFVLLLVQGCGLFRADETPVVMVLASPTPEVVLGPPHVEVEVLDMPLPELLGGFATPTPDPHVQQTPIFIVMPPTPTPTPWVIVVTATPLPPTPFIPTPTSDLGVVLPVTGADLTVQPAAAPSFWSVGLLLAGILLVALGIFRARR
jgi:hypothetical protein